MLPAWAQEEEEEEESERGLDFGVSGELRYDDNIYLAETNEVSSTILEIVPFVTGTIYNKGNTYELGYRLNHAEYFDAADDNYDDHQLTADLNHRFSPRHAIAVTGTYSLLSEERGTGFSEEPNEVTDTPDEYLNKQVDLKYLLGLPTADLRFELGAGLSYMDFDSSYVGDSRDYREDHWSVLARYRWRARSDLLLEYRKVNVVYDNTPLDFDGEVLNLNSDEDFLLGGIGWDLTAKTRGEFMVGRSARDYDREDFSTSDLHWEAELEWRPKTYSRFTLLTSRTAQETYGSGLFVNSRKVDLIWKHDWKGYLVTELAGGLIEDNYEASDRVDDRLHYRLGVGYDYSEWLAFWLGFRHQENDSTNKLVNYEQNTLYLKVSIEF